MTAAEIIGLAIIAPVLLLALAAICVVLGVQLAWPVLDAVDELREWWRGRSAR